MDLSRLSILDMEPAPVSTLYSGSRKTRNLHPLVIVPRLWWRVRPSWRRFATPAPVWCNLRGFRDVRRIPVGQTSGNGLFLGILHNSGNVYLPFFYYALLPYFHSALLPSRLDWMD